MLVLFDIDGTLLRSRGVGLRAMKAALEDLHPPRSENDVHDLDAIDTAGRLDPLIWRELLEQRDILPSEAQHAAFRARYGRLLTDMIEAERPVIGLPGAAEAVAWTRDHPDLIAGVLTGNYPETGRLKVAAAGIDPDDFVFGVWGHEAPTRRGLPTVALERVATHAGRPVVPEETVIVGDTPADIDCARANGMSVIAVCTGRFDASALAEHEPDALLPDLADLGAFQSAVQGCLGSPVS